MCCVVQDTKCIGLQYLEAIRELKNSGFEPTRTVYLSFVPDEEIGGNDGAEMLANSAVFEKMNVAFVLDEGGHHLKTSIGQLMGRVPLGGW